MHASASELPEGMAGLRYGITQVSLAVRDLDRTMARYHRAFGWAPWQVFDHVPPVHHATELRGRPVHYALRGAEVYVGSLNFELLQPLEGPNLWTEFMDRRGEGIASIATMFLEREDGDAVKAAFRERFGIEVSMKADIGDHIEYYYLDTESRFGCLIESGSGHAIDFVKPAQVYPHPGAEPGPSPVSGIAYPITQVSLTVRDLDRTAACVSTRPSAGARGASTSRGAGGAIRASTWRGRRSTSDVRSRRRWSATSTSSSSSRWAGRAVRRVPRVEGRGHPVDRRDRRVGRRGRARQGTVRGRWDRDRGVEPRRRRRWLLLDTEAEFKCSVGVGTGHAYDTVAPSAVFP